MIVHARTGPDLYVAVVRSCLSAWDVGSETRRQPAQSDRT